MSLTTQQALSTPTDTHKLNEENLAEYLTNTLEGVPKLQRLTVRQFTHGQSNPTYLVEAESRKFVLRKKPPGQVLASAHAVEREYTVLTALAETNVPVPKARALCTDPAVIGTPFYVMDYVKGNIFVDPAMPSVSPSERRAAYIAMAKTLAALHSVNPAEVGLQKFGRSTGYCSRQVWRWSRQYAAQLKSAPLKEMQQLISWLESHVPESDSDPATTCIAHGDYRLDNLVLDPRDSGRVLAVLDWELSTLGHPIADLAYSTMPYHLPAASQAVQALPNPLPQGVLEEEQYVEWYCQAAGIQRPAAGEWGFCLGLSLFRMAAILAGVGARAALGTAASATAARVGSEEMVRSLAQHALQIIGSTNAAPSRTLFESHSLLARLASELSPPPPPRPPHTPHVDPRPAARISAGFEPPQHVKDLVKRMKTFIRRKILPVESELEELANSEQRWTIHPKLEELKQAARAEGLWNLWISEELAASFREVLPSQGRGADRQLAGAGLCNLEYAHLSQAMGGFLVASEVFNCSAPDTGNMEVLARYATPAQQRRWLLPLLRGDCRSCFAMTEPAVASSDATNIQASIRRDGSFYVLNGRKWWASGAMDPRCKLCIFMGKTDATAAVHRQQSMILVPMDTPGVAVLRPLPIFGYDDAPHGHAEVDFKDVRVPVSNLILGEGRGFEIAQGRLGPGRLHHCMRLIGMGERAMELMGRRALAREAFGKLIAHHGSFAADFARCRIQLAAARLTVLDAADALDKHGTKQARGKLAVAKVLAPAAVLAVIDQAIQVHGGGGVSGDLPLARLWAQARTLRLADGPDAVHLLSLAKLELAGLAASKL